MLVLLGSVSSGPSVDLANAEVPVQGHAVEVEDVIRSFHSWRIFSLSVNFSVGWQRALGRVEDGVLADQACASKSHLPNAAGM